MQTMKKQLKRREWNRNKKPKPITRKERLEKRVFRQLPVPLRRIWICSCRILRKSQNCVNRWTFIKMRTSLRSWSQRLAALLLMIKIRNQLKLPKEKLNKEKKAPKLPKKVVRKIGLSKRQIWNRRQNRKMMMTVGNLRKRMHRLFNWANFWATWKLHVMMEMMMRIPKMRILKRVKHND